MASQRLQKGPTYKMMVTDVEQKRSFNQGTPPTRKYVHHITFIDNEGVSYIGEYVTETQTQDIFIKGAKSPEFVVTLQGTYGDEIMPVGYVTAKGKEDMKSQAQQSTNWQQPHRSAPSISGNVVPPMSAQSYVFALGMAKDIMAQQVASFGREIDDTFKNDLFNLAESMNEWLIKKQKEQSVIHA